MEVYAHDLGESSRTGYRFGSRNSAWAPQGHTRHRPSAGKEAPGIYRYRIGTFEITALYDGIWYRPITDKFIRNAPFTEVEHALAEAFMPADKLATPFTT